jgi:transposase-like protein
MPELVIVDGAPGLDAALAVLRSDVAIQRCTVHKHRNLLAHAPERLHVRIDFHWLFGKRVKGKSLSPASSRLSATALHFRRHLRMNALRFVAISSFVSA